MGEIVFHEVFPEGGSKVAVDAFDRIRVGARNASMLLMTHQAERQCILDGSAYSPSWRALPEGERIYRAAEAMQDKDAAEALVLDFEETLDECIDQWSSRNEETMGWDNGMLFVFGPEYDFDNNLT